MSKKPKITDVNKFFFIFVILYLFFQIILALAVNLLSLYGQHYVSNFYKRNFYMITLISEYGIILLPALVFVYVKKLPFREVFKIKGLGFIPAVLIIVSALPAYAVALMLNSIVLYMLQFFGSLPQNVIPVPQSFPEYLLGIFVIAVTPAICEEMMHRGLFLDAYERRGSYRAVAITAFLFAIFHFDITNFIGPLFLGVLIGFYVVRTNSIFAGILAHFLNNSIALTIQYFTKNLYLPEQQTVAISMKDLFAVILIGITGFIILAGMLTLFKSVTDNKAVIFSPISSVGRDIVSVISHWPIIIVLGICLLMTVFTLLSIYIGGISY